ncbi:prepilin peptidase [Sphaerisporangium dianthi]|uniref:Prepilin peptidase n=1 Tax=Sphaerisporangium dianthi TaxID=1436120 RepID=A0ABV9CF90_9ACTN
MSLIVAGAALAGLLAGAYVRALAGGFHPDPDGSADATEHSAEDARSSSEGARGSDGSAAGLGGAAEGSGERAGGAREDAGALRRVYRAEAREAFRRVSRAVPLPAWPPSIEVLVAAVSGLVAWKLAGTGLLAAWLYMALTGCALAVIDWRTRRLPDALTLPSYPIVAALLIPTGRAADALLGGLALAGAYAVLWFARPTGLGLGDVKLAGLVGMLTGALGWDAWLVGALAGQFLGALYAVCLLAARRGTLKSEFPLGPFILLGTFTALLSWPPS